MGQTCIPAAAVQPELTPIRPSPALLPDRFLLCRHATPTNYGGLTRNRLDCDLKLRFIFLVGLRVCVCVEGDSRMFEQMREGVWGAFQSLALPL